MAEENGEPRATVALVAEKVEGLKSLTKEGFVSVQRQLDGLSALPREVSELKSEVRDHDKRLDLIESREEKDREWKRGPLLLIAGGLIFALINILPAVIHAT